MTAYESKSGESENMAPSVQKQTMPVNMTKTASD